MSACTADKSLRNKKNGLRNQKTDNEMTKEFKSGKNNIKFVCFVFGLY